MKFMKNLTISRFKRQRRRARIIKMKRRGQTLPQPPAKIPKSKEEMKVSPPKLLGERSANILKMEEKKKELNKYEKFKADADTGSAQVIMH